MSYTCLEVANAARLVPGRRSGTEQLYRCPRHEDTHPSLSINVQKNLWMCGPCSAKGTDWQLAAFLAGADAGDKPTVLAWLNQHRLTPTNGAKPDSTDRRIMATYSYLDEVGKVLYEVVRFEPKNFRQRRPDGTWNLEGVRRVLYRLPELLRAQAVYIVEGEKDVDNLRAIGVMATCNPGGALKWQPEFSDCFKPHQRVVIIPDNDEPGDKHAQQIAESLTGKVASLKMVALPNLPPKGDVSDWITSGGTREQLEALAATAPEFEAGQGPHPVLIRLSDVQPEQVHWLWPYRMAAGKLSLVIGDPGNGKSTALLDVASRITKGAEWPDGGCAEVGSVIILTAEDGLADTVRPRLDIQGGDASRIHVLQAVRSGQQERPFSLVSDLRHLESAIKTVRDVQLIIIDPLSAYLGDKNSYKDAEIRTLLTPLAALAERYGVALVGILHLTKDEQRKALYRAQGTIAFVAAARTVFAVGKDTENPDRRIFVCVKNNLAAHPPALAFSIVEEAGRGRLEWESEPIKGVDADSVLSMSLTLAEREDRQNVDSFLRKLLDSGPVASTKVYQAARQNGFSESTVNRAKTRLGIDAMKTGQPGETDQKWYWVLPKIVTKAVNARNVTTFVQPEQPKTDDSIPLPKAVTKVGVTAFGDNLRSELEEFEL